MHFGTSTVIINLLGGDLWFTVGSMDILEQLYFYNVIPTTEPIQCFHALPMLSRNMVCQQEYDQIWEVKC